jgi:FKBP-type peptidyl-prolyl cis-trans isomerase
MLAVLAWMPLQAENVASFSTAAGGVKYRDMNVGSGPVAQKGMIATIHFKGWLDEDGVRGPEIIHTRAHGRSVSFLIGTDKVMPAWNAGVVGMQPGGTRLLLVPSDMAYADKGVDGLVPKNAPLVLQIELLSLEPYE